MAMVASGFFLLSGQSGLILTSVAPYFAVRLSRFSEFRRTVGTRSPQPTSTITSRICRLACRQLRTLFSHAAYAAAWSCPGPPGPCTLSPSHAPSSNIKMHGLASLPHCGQRTWLNWPEKDEDVSGAGSAAPAMEADKGVDGRHAACGSSLVASSGCKSRALSPVRASFPALSSSVSRASGTTLLRTGARIVASSTSNRRVSGSVHTGDRDARLSLHGFEHCQRCMLPCTSRISVSSQPLRRKKQSTLEV
eukprot:6213819-Pleurochrysis_carterae.AAC.2